MFPMKHGVVYGALFSPVVFFFLSPCTLDSDRMMAQTEMKTETSINSFAEEGGTKSKFVEHANFMGFQGLLDTSHGL